MSDQTTVVDEEETTTPPSEEAEQPSEESEPTDTVESLNVKLAAEAEKTEEALEDAKRWKNRVKEENPPKKKEEESSEDYFDWKDDNRSRINLVKEAYEKELSELQESGAKLTNAIRDKALNLAEETVGVKKEESAEPIPEGEVDRSGDKEPHMTATDQAFGVKPETVKKYAPQVKE